MSEVIHANKETKSRKFSISLPANMKKRLEEMARQDQRTVSGFIQKLISREVACASFEGESAVRPPTHLCTPVQNPYRMQAVEEEL